MKRFVLTHDSDFGTLAFHRGEAFTGIIYLRPGGRPPTAVIADLQLLLDTEIDWTPPLMAVYQKIVRHSLTYLLNFYCSYRFDNISPFTGSTT